MPATIAALVVMTLMSTSSTGYVGLAVLALCYSASLLWRLQFDDFISKKAAITEIIILICVGLIVVAAFATNTALYDSASNLINVLIFQKTQSASYLEAVRLDSVCLVGTYPDEWVGRWSRQRTSVKLVLLNPK
ncbi:MAG: hypothetical protein WDN29_08010 [Methylovirgula sp.]